MYNKKVIQEALRSSLDEVNDPHWTADCAEDDQSSATSLLIHEVFGGEILKTHKKRGWHFYNRIDGERIDFTGEVTGNPAGENPFEDIPSTPDETYNYFPLEDYATFFNRFIRAFEEYIGLDKFKPGLSA